VVSPKHRPTLAEQLAKVGRPERTTAIKPTYLTAKFQLSELTKFCLFFCRFASAPCKFDFARTE
jgi:hypothetical protein